jgi:peptidoglycan LD-endopeptidase CwlK
MVFGKQSLKNLEGVHPKLVLLMKTAILTSPVDFTITEGVRTAKRQNELYQQGRTKPGPVVTTKDGYVKKSNHQPKASGYGCAVDLYPYVNGGVSFKSPKAQKIIADHIKAVAKELNIKIVCGIDWTVPHDPPHFELK